MAYDTRTLSANDRLKRRSGDYVALSLILATGVHFLVFQMWPEMTALVPDDDEPTIVDIIEMDDIPLPAPPTRIDRPAVPVISAEAPDEATINPPSFEEMADFPPPPPPDTRDAAAGASPFVVYDVPPRLLNPDELQRALLRVYPTSLRDAGIGGTVTLQVHIDEEGRAIDARIVEESGYSLFDRAALGLIDDMRFSPAQNRDRYVAVWVEIPIDFRVRRDAGEARSG